MPHRCVRVVPLSSLEESPNAPQLLLARFLDGIKESLAGGDWNIVRDAAQNVSREVEISRCFSLARSFERVAMQKRHGIRVRPHEQIDCG